MGHLPVWSLALRGPTVIATAGTRITVQRLQGELSKTAVKIGWSVQAVIPTDVNCAELTHVLEAHKKPVCCIDVSDNMILSGGADRAVCLFRLGPFGQNREIQNIN